MAAVHAEEADIADRGTDLRRLHVRRRAGVQDDVAGIDPERRDVVKQDLPAAASGSVLIEVLVLENVDRIGLFALVQAQAQLHETLAVMDPDLGDRALQVAGALIV